MKYLIILSMFFGLSAIAGPSDNLKKFVGSFPEKPKVLDRKEDRGKLSDDDFAKGSPNSKVAPPPTPPLSETSRNKPPVMLKNDPIGGSSLTAKEEHKNKIIVSPPLKAQGPVVVLHTPETLHSAGVYSGPDGSHLFVNISLFEDQYKKLSLEKYLRDLSLLSPRINILGSYSLSAFSVTPSVTSALNFKKHGIGVKLNLYGGDVLNFSLDNFHSYLSAYYFYPFQSVFFDYDFLVFYLSFQSGKVHIKSLKDLKEAGADLFREKGVDYIVGVFYNFDVLSTLSLSFETNMKSSFLLSLNYGVK